MIYKIVIKKLVSLRIPLFVFYTKAEWSNPPCAFNDNKWLLNNNLILTSPTYFFYILWAATVQADLLSAVSWQALTHNGVWVVPLIYSHLAGRIEDITLLPLRCLSSPAPLLFTQAGRIEDTDADTTLKKTC